MEIKLIKKTDTPYGLDALAALSYSAAAASALSAVEKRKLMFSLYSLRCLFDNADLLDPPTLLLQYGCSFLFPPSAHPKFQEQGDFFSSALLQTDPVFVAGGGLIISRDGDKKLKFDAGSQLFSHFAQTGQISAEFAEYPQKFGLLQAIDLLLAQKTATAELKSMWLLLFPFLLGDAPDEDDLLEFIAQKLNTEEIYRAAFFGDFSGIVPPDPAETFVNQSFAAGWFSGYDKWRKDNAPQPSDKIYSVPPFFGRGHSDSPAVSPSANPSVNSGHTNVANADDSTNSRAFPLVSDFDGNGFQMDDEKIAQNAEILTDAERLFAQNPNNEDALLLLLAARTNQPPQNQTQARLVQNIELIAHYLPVFKSKYILAYYLGLSFLGLRQIDKACRAFELCLKLKPDYAPAVDMLNALNSGKSIDLN